MPIALTDDHRALADSASAFATRYASTANTRAQFDAFAAGKLPAFWDRLCEQGLHLLHLPERSGGFGAGLVELAIVTEQLGRALCPGPFLPTVLASATLAGADLDDQGVRTLLDRFTGGATGVLVDDAGLTATRDGEDWVVNGSTEPILGLPGADLVLVAASAVHDRDLRIWFALPAAGREIETLEPLDLTRSVGRLTVRGHRVAATDQLPQVPIEWVELVRCTLFAAEAAGLSRWGLQTAVDHVRTREQFGQPVGRFQAVQHKAAKILVGVEIASAVAWDAARAESHDAEQRRVAAVQAALAALPSAVDNALDTILLLGGIGFTWEHDAHLYQRRAISIAALAGPQEVWEQRLGELALAGARRDFSFIDADALPDLRAQVREAVSAASDLSHEAGRADGRGGRRGGSRQFALAAAGLVGPHYPQPYGLNADAAEQAVIAQEFAAAGVTPPEIVIGEWVLPTLLAYGSGTQQERFVAPTLRGEIFWCQLFSEPGAGSDLAGLRTRAIRCEGGWRISGQKVWTSLAHEAEWGVCLARTDPDAPKHKGISYFLIDMGSPGITVRPLRQATGRAEFNEVFLDDVFVPDECLVGEPNQGWRLAVTTLANERLSMGGSLLHGPSSRVRELIESDRLVGPRADAVRALGRCVSRELSLAAINLRGVLARLAGADRAAIGAEISVQKVFNAMAQRDNSRDLLRLLGPAAAAVDTGVALDDVGDHIALPSVLLGGGTIEIQLNVIAQRVLGLPR